MSFPVRVTNASINVLILMLTIFSPNETTLIATIPILFSSVAWIFLKDKEFQGRKKFLMNFLSVISVVIITTIVFVHFSAKITMENNAAFFGFNKDIIYLSRYRFPYWWFIAAALSVTVLSSIIEIVIEMAKNKNPGNVCSKCFEELLDE